ncbi:unnamed protein product, partial [Durusdinium trenchii]
THEEGGVHAAAMKHGLAPAADIHFMQIPVCAGHADDGYIYDQEGVNLTLQSAARSITESLNKLSTDGVVVRDRSTGEVCAFHGFVVNFKGDWKYLAQLFNMTKTAQKEEVCWKCGATKGTNDPELCYVNLSPDAPWRAVVTPPWTQRPAYADLEDRHRLVVGKCMVQLYVRMARKALDSN